MKKAFAALVFICIGAAIAILLLVHLRKTGYLADVGKAGTVADDGKACQVNMVSEIPRSEGPRRVALVVQNHTSDMAALPMAALADTLASQISGKTLRVVNPQNVIGVGQNRTAAGEAMPDASVQDIGRMLGAEGVVTASVQEFAGEDIGVPAVAYRLKMRLALNLADAATGATVCGVDVVKVSKNYTAEKVKSDTATLYEGLMHSAAADAAEKLLAKVSAAEWRPEAVERAKVTFTCNMAGAIVKIDGVAVGPAPVVVTVTKGIHHVSVEYPFCIPFVARSYCADGQAFNVTLELDETGRERFRSDALFAEIIDRIRKTGATDDCIRKTLAEGTVQYWKEISAKIANGETPDLKIAPPDGAEAVPKSTTVDQLIDKAKGL